jgi:uncharacterized protein
MSGHRVACGGGQIPIRPGLFELPRGSWAEPHLIGTRCLDCGMSFFPKRACCAVCFSRSSVVDGPLSRRGRIESATAVRQAPVEYRGEVPYALGLVRLPEGVLIHAPLTGKDPGAWQLGDEVELVIEPIHTRADGTEILAYKFRALASGMSGKEGSG